MRDCSTQIVETGTSARIQVRAPGGSRPLNFGEGPLLSSRATPWAGTPFEVHRVLPRVVRDFSGPPPGEQGLLIILSGAIDVHERRGGQPVFQGRPGSACMLAGRYPRFVEQIEGEAVAVAVRLDASQFHRLGLDGPPSRFGLTATEADPTVLSLTEAMVREVQTGSGSGRLFAESLSTALLSYLLQHLDSEGLPSTRGRLSATQANLVREYIESHLAEDLTLSTLAAELGMSPRRFTSAFRLAFDTSPHQYVLRRRVYAAMERLTHDNASLEAIAEQVGFSSASHLSRAFRHVTGSAPRRYAKEHARRARPSQECG